MADTIITTNILGVGLESTDPEGKSKTVYLKLPNPKENLTESQIKTAVQSLITGAEPILFDSYGNPFDSETAIATAYTESQENIEVDIGLE